MGITFLTALLFGAIAFFAVCFIDKKNKKQSGGIKWITIFVFAIFGLTLGSIISSYVGENIEKKYLANQAPVTVLENIDLLPFSNRQGVYIVTGENQYGKKVAWYLQKEKEELFEEPYNDNANMIIFTDDTAPVKQSVKVDVGSFWKWFAIIPCKYRFVVPTGGLQEGKIEKIYKFISKS